ncbi:hypothetical protein FVF58_09490 [Paraburkholderia panacisoli]|uniref:Uncharacterized protein n=1 Tax=Paraburkholderia panacisoli TaxID=2603818 RepID=A0A5B0HDH1_9BURK|nr:hypothetical protein [Paraburkholderia panacisoli]KAA1013013.1 hypothetical protein FVF58_09490 [Paraburkholderia panacisoli]
MGKLVSEFPEALLGPKPRGAFSFPPAMRSYALPSSQYGNPEDVYAATQAREKRQAQQEHKRPTLTLKPRKQEGWSEARKRAEELFHPAAPCSVE